MQFFGNSTIPRIRESEMKESSVWKWAGETFLQYWKYMVTLLVFSMIMASAGFLVPMVWQMLLDRAVAGSMDQRLALTLLVLLVVQCVPVAFLLRERFINRYRFNTKYRLFKHMLRLSIPFHKDKESTKLVMESGKGVDASTRLMKYALQGHILADVPIAIASFVYIATHAPQPMTIMTVLLVFFIVFLFLNKYFGSRIAAVEEESQELDNEVSTRQREVVQQIETVKLHRAERQEEDWYQREGQKARTLEDKQDNYLAWFSAMGDLAHVLPFTISLFIFLPYVAEGTITVGTLVALQLYCSRAVTPAGFLGDVYQEIKTNAAKLKPALRILAHYPTVAEADHPIEMNPLRHQIELKNVSFSYPDTKEPTIRELSLAIEAGERIAVVGKTGSGKSTLARLLVRFYDPDHGMITMDGTDLRQVSFESLYEQISYVMQEVPVFSGTIGDNVSYGLRECGDDQVGGACRQASANFVFTHKQGLGTKVGELGEKLSGGERQRLALARVFLRKPSLLILDEATSALDETTQREVQEAFLTINGGTTIVAIAHRITTVKGADRIVVLDDGGVVDVGPHSELLDRCVLYQELCQGMAD